MTRSEIKAEIFRRLREVSSAPVFWTEQDLDNSIDEGVAEISDATEWFESYNDIELPRGVPAFDVRQFTTYEFLAVGPAYNSQTNRWLTPEVPRTFDAGDRAWESRIAEPGSILVRGLWWLTYWPFVVRSIRQYYTGLPGVLGDSEEPGFPEQFHYGIVEYALWDLWAQDSEVDLAWAAWKLYLGYEQGLKKYVEDRIGVPKVNAMHPSEND